MWRGTADRTADTISRIRWGYFSSVAPPVVAVDGGSRAAEIDVDRRCAGLVCDDGRRSHATGISAEKLHLYRQAGRSVGSAAEFRNMTQKDTLGRNLDADAQELRNRERKGAGLPLQSTHGGVGDPVHWSQNERWRISLQHVQKSLFKV